MKKTFGILLASAVLIAPSTTALASTTEPEPEPIEEVQPYATTVSWVAESLSPSASDWSDAFAISSSKSSLKLEQIIQGSFFSPAKIEYRLYKKSGSNYVDTGIYDVLEGAYQHPNFGTSTLYGSISSGTYKIKMTNKGSKDTSSTGVIKL